MSAGDTMATPPGGGRRALITGASVGIGAAFAERLARDQYDLVLVARRADPLEELAKRLHDSRGVDAQVMPADLTLESDLQRVADYLGEAAIDVLVNNAGMGTVGRFHELDAARELEEIRLNVLALVRLTHAALPGMVARGHGRIINVSSMAGFAPMPFEATYAATKAFVNCFTEALHEELRDTGVRVQALCPGFTRTEFQERAGIDPSRVPGFAWMEPEPVVEASLAGIERGELICVPGVGNRLLATLQRVTPSALTRRLVSRFGNPAIGR
jgi:short-subunit dehydrogenase